MIKEKPARGFFRQHFSRRRAILRRRSAGAEHDGARKMRFAKIGGDSRLNISCVHIQPYPSRIESTSTTRKCFLYFSRAGSFTTAEKINAAAAMRIPAAFVIWNPYMKVA